MKSCTVILLGLCLFVLTAHAYPMFPHRKGFGPPMIPVPVHPYPHPYPGYGPGRRGGLGDGLTFLTSAALLGTGNPLAQAVGGLGLFSSIF